MYIGSNAKTSQNLTNVILSQDYFNKGFASNDNNEKVQLYSKAIELNPNYAHAYKSKGNTLNDLKRHDEAIQCFDKAIEIDPNYSGAYNNKGYALTQLKRYEEAIQCSDKAIELNPHAIFIN